MSSYSLAWIVAVVKTYGFRAALREIGARAQGQRLLLRARFFAALALIYYLLDIRGISRKV